jgi:glycogen debranching enzyme
VWAAPNYQIATGLAHYGFKELAAEIADKTDWVLVLEAR